MGRKKIFGLVFFLLALSAVFGFSRFAKTEKQDISVQKSQGSVENVQGQPVVVTQVAPLASDIVEPEKVISSAVPIFMYHYIRAYSNPADPIGENLSVSPQKFEEQLSWLKRNNYATVFSGYFKNPKAVAAKPIILTFDDGYQDAYDSAFSLLQKYQMTGMFYLIVNKIGTPGYLTWEEILEMQKAGMMFGSHTLTHSDLRNLSPVNLEKEIKESREILTQKLGQEVTDFCYPSGKYSDTVLAEVKKDKYQTAVTTNSGISSLKDDPFLLKRLRIVEKTNVEAILGK